MKRNIITSLLLKDLVEFVVNDYDKHGEDRDGRYGIGGLSEEIYICKPDGETAQTIIDRYMSAFADLPWEFIDTVDPNLRCELRGDVGWTFVFDFTYHISPDDRPPYNFMKSWEDASQYMSRVFEGDIYPWEEPNAQLSEEFGEAFDLLDLLVQFIEFYAIHNWNQDPENTLHFYSRIKPI